MNTPAASTAPPAGSNAPTEPIEPSNGSSTNTRTASTTEQPPLAHPSIAFGSVRHTRLRPSRHAFVYGTYFLMLPMRSLRRSPEPALPRNRFGLISFFDRDHGDGGDDALAWLEQLLHDEGITDAQGEVWLQTYPRVLGYAFKPVSFWYAHRADGALAAIVAEVNNTFGERHCYLLRDPSAHAGLPWGRELMASKVFHVSPFCAIEGRYRFRFMRTTHTQTHTDATAHAAMHPSDATVRKPRDATEHIIARVDHDDAQGPLLQTSVSGHLVPFSRGNVHRAFWGMPLMSFGIVARIHWQALRLWLKRVPFFGKPVPPSAFVSR